MFKLVGRNTSKKVSEAIQVANSSAYKVKLKNNLNLIKSYDMSTAKPDYIHRKIFAVLENDDIYVKIYYPRWKYSKAIGYFSPSNPRDINMNGYKLNRSKSQIVGTLYHELVHMADNVDMIKSYGHGDNSPKGKSNTAPYLIGSKAASCVDISDYETKDIHTYRKYTPWYKKLYRWLF